MSMQLKPRSESENKARSEESDVLIDMPLPEEEAKDEEPGIYESVQGYADVQERMEPKTCHGLTNPLTNDGDTIEDFGNRLPPRHTRFLSQRPTKLALS
jgi:hypothetical protein